MKLHGFVGSGTGKLGNSVFSSNAGRTIVRQYNPEVKNPKTERQQAARARFKFVCELAKKVAAAVSIGMPRVGALTSRNQFTKMYLPFGSNDVIQYEGGEYSVDWENLMVAKGGMPVPQTIGFVKDPDTMNITFSLSGSYDPEAAGYIPSKPGQAGIVIAFVNEDEPLCVVKQWVPASQQTLVVNTSEFGEKPMRVYAFGKWVMNSHTTVSPVETPWLYPSDQSDSLYIGNVI